MGRLTEVVVRPLARAEIEDAALWYENRRDGLGLQFLSQIDVAMDAIAAHPRSAALVRGDLRRQLLHGFPYGLFYRLTIGEQGQERALIEACFHAKQSPRRWSSR